MLKSVDILKLIKGLLAACLVVFMLTACNGNDQENTAQTPLATSSSDGSTLADDWNGSSDKDASLCWQTEIVNVLYDIMGKVALTTYRKMTGGAMSLVMVAFAIWMTTRLVKQLSSFKEETMGEVWTEIAKVFFLCIFCGLIASKVDLLVIVLGDVIFPIYNAFLEFAAELMRVVVPQSGGQTVSIFGVDVNIDSQVTCAAKETVTLTASSDGFPDSPKQMMDCLICAASNSLSFGMTLAFNTLRNTSFTAWIVGLFVLACFMFVKLAFAFYLVDTIFRFTVMVVMLPLMIMGFPFEKTRGLLSQGVKNMVNSAAFMMFFALIISLCIQAIQTILNSFKDVFTGNDAFKDFSIPFVCMMMIAFLVISSVQIAGKLCDSIVGGSSNATFQKSAKALIVGAAKWVGSLGMKLVSSVVPTKAFEGINNKINKVMGAVNKFTGGD